MIYRKFLTLAFILNFTQVTASETSACETILKGTKEFRTHINVELPKPISEKYEQAKSLFQLAEDLKFKGTIQINEEPPFAKGNSFLSVHKASSPTVKKELFVKVPNFGDRKNANLRKFETQAEHVASELLWTKYLSDSGWGAKFYGAVRMPDNRVGIVTEYLPGNTLEFSEIGFKDLSRAQKQNAQDRLRKMRTWLIENNLHVDDLQIRFDRQGKPYIIDPEHFTYVDYSSNEKAQRSFEKDINGYIGLFNQ